MIIWQTPKVIVSFGLLILSILCVILCLSGAGWAYADAIIMNASGERESHFHRGLFEFCVESVCDYTGARVHGEKVMASFLIISLFIMSAATVSGYFSIRKGYIEAFKPISIALVVAGVMIFIGTGVYSSEADHVFAHTNNYDTFEHFRFGWCYVVSWCAGVFCIASASVCFFTSRDASALNVTALTNV